MAKKKKKLIKRCIETIRSMPGIDMSDAAQLKKAIEFAKTVKLSPDDIHKMIYKAGDYCPRRYDYWGEVFYVAKNEEARTARGLELMRL
ncbi:hypothetical protein [Pararhizobium polonicum]|nr:hypothetical protein [Pararhizobium polonicum]